MTFREFMDTVQSIINLTEQFAALQLETATCSKCGGVLVMDTNTAVRLKFLIHRSQRLVGKLGAATKPA
jgi:transcription initiation factor IIE alpha subunit